MNKIYTEDSLVRLRSIETSDIDILYSWENIQDDWINNQYYNPISKEFIRNFILNSSNYLSHNSDIIMIIDNFDNDSVGYVQLTEYDAINRRASIGVFIDVSHRGKGYGRNALINIMNYAFNRWNIRMLYAKILGTNNASIKLFESVGFSLVASIPQWEWVNNDFVSLNYYQICNL